MNFKSYYLNSFERTSWSFANYLTVIYVQLYNIFVYVYFIFEVSVIEGIYE